MAAIHEVVEIFPANRRAFVMGALTGAISTSMEDLGDEGAVEVEVRAVIAVVDAVIQPLQHLQETWSNLRHSFSDAIRTILDLIRLGRGNRRAILHLLRRGGGGAAAAAAAAPNDGGEESPPRSERSAGSYPSVVGTSGISAGPVSALTDSPSARGPRPIEDGEAGGALVQPGDNPDDEGVGSLDGGGTQESSLDGASNAARVGSTDSTFLGSDW